MPLYLQGNNWQISLPVIAVFGAFLAYNYAESQTYWDLLQTVKWLLANKWALLVLAGVATVGVVSLTLNKNLLFNY